MATEDTQTKPSYLSGEYIFRNVTAATHASKQWMKPHMLDDAYEHLRTNKESGLSIQKLRVSDRTHRADKYTLKCNTHSTFSPYTSTNVEFLHHIAKNIGRGKHPHFCDSCATPNTDKDSTPATSNSPISYA
jgi:hypothetical protein